MRTRRSVHAQAAEVARRRLELLEAELAALRVPAADGGGARAAGERDPAGAAQPSDSPTDAAPGAAPALRDDTARAGRVDPSGGPPSPAPGATAPGRAGRHARRRRLPAWPGADRLAGVVSGVPAFGPGHLALVGLLVVAALAVSAWWAVGAHDAGEPVPVAAPITSRVASPPAGPGAVPGTPAVAAAGAAGTIPSGGATGAGTDAPVEIVIDVAGRVRRPGIARLPPGSRVVDAIEAAGGVRRGVDLSTLNLARVLVDGEQVLVGRRPAGGRAAASSPSGSAPGSAGSTGGAAPPLVSLNTADQATLETLPGVGPVTAQAILQWRAEHGAFTAVEELLEVSGIGEVTLAELTPLVTL